MLNIYQESISGALNIIKNIQILFVNIKCLIIYKKLYTHFERRETTFGDCLWAGRQYDNNIIII